MERSVCNEISNSMRIDFFLEIQLGIRYSDSYLKCSFVFKIFLGSLLGILKVSNLPRNIEFVVDPTSESSRDSFDTDLNFWK